MSFDTILPTPELSHTETDIVIELFQNPAVQKCLKILAINGAKELLELSAVHSQDATIAKALATIQGKLQLVEALLSLKRDSYQ